MAEKIKILDVPWHLAHQYDQYCALEDTCEFYWLIQHRRGYSDGPRGDMVKRFNIKLIPQYEPGQCDIAILHLDQQCLEESLWDRGKGSVYKELNEVIQDIPKILLMHGTPYYPEQFECDITEENYEHRGYTKDQVGMSSELIDLCKRELGNNLMVVNSKKAAKQWGQGTPIWHAMDPDEWRDLPKEPRVVTMISPGGLDRYYDRTFLKGIKDELEERNIFHCHITVDAQFKNWEEYRTFLGRSLIYINPTKESCMPRSRTEAMLSGCCVLTTPWQDADEFIKDGKNGFIIPRNPKQVADLVETLLKDYSLAVKIGQKGKETALKLFTRDRYRDEWMKIINEAIKK